MNVLDLFSGIGGFSLGLERAGFTTVAFCEIDPYCRAVLRKHWPDVPCYGDIRELSLPDGFADLICGGFPCQDISVAGQGAGIEGERSGLWKEYARIIGEVRPRYVIVENVAALLNRGLERVLGDLASLGYDAEWHCIPACAVGAPHRRDRIWIVAYPGCFDSDGRGGEWTGQEAAGSCDRSARSGQHTGDVAHANGERELQQQGIEQNKREWLGNSGEDLAHPDKPRLERWLRASLSECSDQWAVGEGDSQVSHSEGTVGEQFWAVKSRQQGGLADRGWWLTEPDVGRVAHGVPARVDRLRALGNAVVPQIPEIIGRAIMASQ